MEITFDNWDAFLLMQKKLAIQCEERFLSTLFIKTGSGISRRLIPQQIHQFWYCCRNNHDSRTQQRTQDFISPAFISLNNKIPHWSIEYSVTNPPSMENQVLQNRLQHLLHPFLVILFSINSQQFRSSRCVHRRCHIVVWIYHTIKYLTNTEKMPSSETALTSNNWSFRIILVWNDGTWIRSINMYADLSSGLISLNTESILAL